MASTGTVPFVTAAVQIIPVLIILVMADDFIRRRDAEDRVHLIHASTAVAVGLLFGITGEVVGLHALLTGPTTWTVPTVGAGLLALSATALLPRLAELHVPENPELARRIAQRLVPSIIGTVGLVTSTLSAPLWWRAALYGFLALNLSLHVADAIRIALRDGRANAQPTKLEPANEQGGPQDPVAHTPIRGEESSSMIGSGDRTANDPANGMKQDPVEREDERDPERPTQSG